jgi:hypothetical protein
VRRTRFTHSVVRSSSISGRRSFDEQFNRRAAPDPKQQQAGFDYSELRAPARSLQQPRAKTAIPASPARPAIPRAKPAAASSQAAASSDGQLKETPAMKQGGEVGHKGTILGVEPLHIPQRHVVQSPKSHGSPDTMEFSFHSEEQSLRLQRVCSSPSPFSANDATLSANPDARSVSLRVAGDGSTKPKKRSKSPIPTRVISDVFREAKAASKRFSSPQRPRKSSSARFLDDSPPFAFSSTRVAGKLVTKRASSWPRNSDARVAKVAALEILEKWTVDRSQLLIGHKFAAGAYSRLFHGIYKEEPVAVKFIRLPDDDEDEELTARLKKQFTVEVTILARLNHRNVIKVTARMSI